MSRSCTENTVCTLNTKQSIGFFCDTALNRLKKFGTERKLGRNFHRRILTSLQTIITNVAVSITKTRTTRIEFIFSSRVTFHLATIGLQYLWICVCSISTLQRVGSSGVFQVVAKGLGQICQQCVGRNQSSIQLTQSSPSPDCLPRDADPAAQPRLHKKIQHIKRCHGHVSCAVVCKQCEWLPYLL